MPYTKVYIHFIWSTKNRFPFLDSFALRQKVWDHIKVNAQSKEIFIDAINGHKEHCHCLMRLDINQTMSGGMQLLKGESSFWINKHNICVGQKFQWQEEYFAISVSESLLAKVRGYINAQEQHHANRDFQSEYDLLMRRYRLDRYGD